MGIFCPQNVKNPTIFKVPVINWEWIDEGSEKFQSICQNYRFWKNGKKNWMMLKPPGEGSEIFLEKFQNHSNQHIVNDRFLKVFRIGWKFAHWVIWWYWIIIVVIFFNFAWYGREFMVW